MNPGLFKAQGASRTHTPTHTHSATLHCSSYQLSDSNTDSFFVPEHLSFDFIWRSVSAWWAIDNCRVHGGAEQGPTPGMINIPGKPFGSLEASPKLEILVSFINDSLSSALLGHRL